ncbi:hypothetical protein [Nocardioides convexus]|uniref:hypothetical protein n=1 Tax=Nocardioides convexus TaxID=2712224 RepID=UPI00241853BB|nr:hypothetical protein [Nocardioides convexus]
MSRATLSRALASLETQGRIEVRHGVGALVRDASGSTTVLPAVEARPRTEVVAAREAMLAGIARAAAANPQGSLRLAMLADDGQPRRLRAHLALRPTPRRLRAARRGSTTASPPMPPRRRTHPRCRRASTVSPRRSSAATRPPRRPPVRACSATVPDQPPATQVRRLVAVGVEQRGEQCAR